MKPMPTRTINTVSAWFQRPGERETGKVIPRPYHRSFSKYLELKPDGRTRSLQGMLASMEGAVSPLTWTEREKKK